VLHQAIEQTYRSPQRPIHLHLVANAARFASFTIDELPLSPVTNSPTAAALFTRGPERPTLSDYEELPGGERTLPTQAASGQYRACFRTTRASCAAHPAGERAATEHGPPGPRAASRFLLTRASRGPHATGGCSTRRAGGRLDPIEANSASNTD
jgi:hypothetical protein